MGLPPFERALPFPSMPGEAHAKTPDVRNIISDEDLIVRVAAKDAAALSLLLDRYSRLVMRITLRILHDEGEAEEVVQDVFFFVHQKAALFDPLKGTGRGWIVQLAYHRAFDRRSYLKRRGFYAGTDVASVADILAGGSDLDQVIGSRLSRAQLEKAFEELPERQRQTLELFYFEGLELREISERLDEPLANIRHHYYRGLKKLQKSAVVQKLRKREK